MKDYAQPCFTLEEAQEKLSLTRTEIEFHIRSRKLQAVLYTKTRPMLIIKPLKNGNWIGLGTCQYRGHVTAHIEYIERLLDGDEVQIGAGYFTLLDKDGISQVSAENPFRDIHQKIEKWLGDSGLKTTSFFIATPLPHETQNLTGMFSNMIADIAGMMAENDPSIAEKIDIASNKKVSEMLILDFKSNSIFDPSDLRVPASELEKCRISSAKNSLLSEVKTLTGNKGKRENQLHTLIDQVLMDFPSIGAKDLWRIMEIDYDRDEPIYDTAGIIQNIDSECIEWKSKYNTEQSTKWNSFQSLISKRRKKLNHINDN